MSDLSGPLAPGHDEANRPVIRGQYPKSGDFTSITSILAKHIYHSDSGVYTATSQRPTKWGVKMFAKSRVLSAIVLAIVLAFYVSSSAFADTLSLEAGSATIAEEQSKASVGRTVLAKFKSGAAGKLYAIARADGAVGYRFQIAKDNRFKMIVRDRTVSGKAKATFCCLTGAKKYYGRVRAYTIENGKTIWGPWSAVKSAKVTEAVIGVAHLPGRNEAPTKRWVRLGRVKVVDITSTKANPLHYDGLVIPGGGDVDPALYGQKRNSHDFGINRKLDLLQFKLIRKFAKANKPVIGLCRGAQVINVAFGGTLRQHIPGWHRLNRKVRIAKNSWLYGMFGAVENTYHYHHQCASKLGKGLKATQWDAKDGHIEAVEHVKYPVYGLQWHPESMGVRGAKVARSYANICSRYSTPRTSKAA